MGKKFKSDVLEFADFVGGGLGEIQSKKKQIPMIVRMVTLITKNLFHNVVRGRLVNASFSFVGCIKAVLGNILNVWFKSVACQTIALFIVSLTKNKNYDTI